MGVHKIILPEKVIIGPGVLGSVAEIVEELASSREGFTVGIVTGPNTYRVGAKFIEEELAKKYRVVLWKAEEASVTVAERIAEEARLEGVKVTIGVGGGKSIDIAKFVASRTGSYLVSVPLAPSHDGVASPFASLKGTDRPTSVYTKTPNAIVADIDLISKSPRRLLLAGFGDIIGKLVAVRDWQLAHKLRGEYYGEYAAQLALLSAKHVLKYHELIALGKPEGVRILVEALISSGVAMCIAGSSRPASGSEHLFSHALEIVAPNKALHGEKVAMGTVIMLYIYGDPRWKKVRDILNKVGLSIKGASYGYTKEELVTALSIAHKIRPERYTILGESGVSREAAERILAEVGVI